MQDANNQRRRLSPREVTSRQTSTHSIPPAFRRGGLWAGLLLFVTGLATWPAYSAEEAVNAVVPPELQGEPWQQITAQSPADKQSAFPERPADVDSQTWAGLQAAVQQAKLLPEPEGIGGETSRFGYSVSVSGNRALVGGINLAGSGAALVLVDSGSGWVEEAVLLPADGASGDQFGAAVSLDGSRALVGARLDDDDGSDSGSAYVFAFDGTNWAQETKLTASDGAPGDQFGFSVSLDGNRALVGALYDDDNGSDSGSAYVFAFDGTNWAQETKLTASDGAVDDYFGFSVSLDDGRVLVGAYVDDDNGSDSGSAYLFAFDGTSWAQETKLTASDGATGDYFGVSVSLDGNQALVGAVYDDDNGSDSGSAYLFAFDGTNWSQETKLTASDGATGDQFGFSVSLDGSRALLAAYQDDDNGSNSGSAYLFTFDGTNWTQETKVTASDGAVDDQFGYSVSLDGSRALLGAHLDDDNDVSSGSAYLFAFDGTNWAQETKFTAPDGAAGDYFGVSVSLDGSRALVGAYGDDDNGSSSGSAYVFDFDGTDWIETNKLTAADGTLGDQFGRSISLFGDRALVGAPFDDDNGSNSGSAYVFEFDGSNWIETEKLTSTDGAANDLFGLSVSMSGDRALIGAQSDDDNGDGSGSAYVFDFDGTNWSETAKLLPSDGTAGDNFGQSISLSGNRALVGADRNDDNGNISGSAYIFQFNGTIWNEMAKLLPGDGAAGDQFGWSVSLTDQRALIGALGDEDNGDNSGSAYVFDFDGSSWSETSKLLPADGAVGTFFGSSVSLAGDRALVGANWDDDNGTHSGSAYIFEFNGLNWSEAAKLLPFDGAAGDRFGHSVSLDDIRVLVGASGNDDHGTESGSAYVFVENQPPTAQPDSVTTDEDSVLNGDVLADNGNGPDSDPDGDLLSVTAVNGSADNVGIQFALTSGALLTVNAAGTFSYDPNGQFEYLASGANTTDSFDYTISDGLASDSATVTVTISGVNDLPEANNTAATTDEDIAVAIPLTGSDIDGDALTFAIATAPSNGSLSAISPVNDTTAAVAYTPDADFNGSDSFTFTVNDGTVDSPAATVAITIHPINDAPEADDTAATTNEDMAVAITLTGSDVDDDGLTFTIATAPSNGSLGAISQLTDTIAQVTYTPDTDYNGSDSFTFIVNDGNADSAPASVDITVSPVNDAPSFTSGPDQSVVEDAGPQAVAGWATDIQAGPANESGQTLSFNVTANSNPALFSTGPAIDSSGMLTYTPAPDTTGVATIAIELTDDGGTANGGVDTSDPATFQISVTAEADLAIAKSARGSTIAGEPGITYTLTVSNSGPSDVSGARVIDTPSPELTGLSWTCAATGQAQCSNTSGNGAIDELVDVSEGDSVVFTLIGVLPEADNGPIDNTATVQSSNEVVDPDINNNSASASFTVAIFSDRFEPTTAN